MNMMQLRYQNPHASMPLTVPYIVVPNTHEKVVDAHIRANSQRDIPWLYASEPHDRVAVICGGGPSLLDDLDVIRAMDGDVFGLNGAALTLTQNGIHVDRQVIIDAQEITSVLVEPEAGMHVFASHVHKETLDRATNPTLFHLNFDGIEDLMPPEKVEAGGYTLVGGGVSVGITALVVAYVMGYRKVHLFGYDSSNRGTATHAYKQAWNEPIPRIDVEWAGKTYNASMPMKLQAEAFPRFAAQLQDEGCEIEVHGDGLLPAIWRDAPMTERQKYQRMWMIPEYGERSPGERVAPVFIDVVKPDGLVIDFGCGSGKGAKALAAAGLDVLLVDFTDNCRDKDVLHLPFREWDLTEPMPFRAPYGFCTDVLEHIPTEDVGRVIRNIMEASPRVFFQIATWDDNWGEVIGQRLHMTVRPHEWWAEQFAEYSIEWDLDDKGGRSCFYVARKD